MTATITKARRHEGTRAGQGRIWIGAVALVLSVTISWMVAAQTPGMLVYVGTYTGQKSKGIYAFRFDPATGALTPIGLAAETRSPSWLTLHPSRRYLYAANETNDFDAEKSGSVSAFSIDRATGALTLLNAQSSRGAHPCHLGIDRTGTHIVAANYSSGNLAVLPIRPDGRLAPASQVVQHAGSSVNAQRQKGPHAHSFDFDGFDKFGVSADLGADRLFVYKYDVARGRLSAAEPPAVPAEPGAGPRHFAFHPNGRLGFAINELTSTVTSYSWNGARGALKPVATISTVPEAVPGNSTAEIRVHPTGQFLYGSNRGHDSIVVFRIAQATGALTLVEHEPTRGKTPRNFTIDPSGRWLIAANQGTDTLTVFRIDEKAGSLTAVGDLTAVGSPVSVVFVQ
jgi:6-phosphogluconolactonase